MARHMSMTKALDLFSKTPSVIDPKPPPAVLHPQHSRRTHLSLLFPAAPIITWPMTLTEAFGTQGTILPNTNLGGWWTKRESCWVCAAQVSVPLTEHAVCGG